MYVCVCGGGGGGGGFVTPDRRKLKFHLAKMYSRKWGSTGMPVEPIGLNLIVIVKSGHTVLSISWKLPKIAFIHTCVSI